MLAQKPAVEQTHFFMIRVYFPPPCTNMKSNPILSMRAFFIEMLKHEVSITVFNPSTKQQIVMATDLLPTTE